MNAKPPVAEQRSYADSQEDAAPPEAASRPLHRLFVVTAAPSWLTSMVVHLTALLVLAWLTIPPATVDDVRSLAVYKTVEAEEIEEIPEFDQPIPPDITTDDTSPKPLAPSPEEVRQIEQPEEWAPDDTECIDDEEPPLGVTFVDFDRDSARQSRWLVEGIGSPTGSFEENRALRNKSRRAQEAGGDERKDAAVNAALKWLAAHQCNNGSWNFDQRRGGPSQANPGTLTQAPRAATGIVILPFLGAGQTHQQGAYQPTVRAGLVYLVRNIKMTRSDLGTFEEPGGRMYSHGICSIALAEAYALTKDRDLLGPAQASINYIRYAQDPVGGGWRYSPKQPGDMSVVGWMLMALKSGHLSYLEVDPNTVAGTSRFLDSVQTESGARYGYTDPGNGDATTAIGLLCRMYLGWKQDNAALHRGVETLSKKGPSKNNMYYNYYATQVLYHVDGPDGPLWRKWDDQMSGYLLETQAKTGPEAGSWYFGGGGHGGGTRRPAVSHGHGHDDPGGLLPHHAHLPAPGV